MLMTIGLVWRVLEKPSAGRVAAAALCAVASVQCLFQNSALLLAICVGAASVALAGGSRRTAGLVLGVGLMAAMSLLPYWGALQRARDWDVIIRDDTSSEGILSKLQQTLSASDEGSWRVWTMLAVYGLAIALWAQFRCKPSSGSNGSTFNIQNTFFARQRSILLFTGVTLVIAVPAYFVFLNHLGYPPRAWYYIALMGLVALLLEILAGSFGSPLLSRERNSTDEAGERGDGAIVRPERQAISAWMRSARVALALLIAGNSLLPTWRQARVRQTNVDLLAAKLNQLAAKDDLVVVAPWFKGISFCRYYHGAAPWMTVPPLEFQKFHRYDLIKDLMTLPDQGQAVRPLLLRIQTTLKSGHKVWTVGVIGLVPPGGDTSVPPPAPSAGWGWQNAKYANRWTGMTVAYLQACARHNEKIPIGFEGQVSEFENLPLRVFDGWSGL